MSLVELDPDARHEIAIQLLNAAKPIVGAERASEAELGFLREWLTDARESGVTEEEIIAILGSVPVINAR